MSKYYKKATLKKEKPSYERLDVAQVQNVKSARVYVFGNEDLDEDEINNEEVELYDVRSRKSGAETKKGKEDDVEIEREITEGDTLQNIALKYGTRVSELKRVNNLISDQDFFALKKIRVPIKRHGLISELVEEEEKTKQSPRLNGALTGPQLAGVHADLTDVNTDTDDPCPVIRTVSIGDVFGETQSQEAQDFLRRMDNDIKVIVSSTSSRKDSLRQVTNSLTCKSIQPMKEKKFFGGADCGIRWWSMVGMMLLVAIIIPLIYLIHFEYVVKSSHTSNSTNH